MRTIFLFLFLFSEWFLTAQIALTPFSDLSGTKDRAFHSYKTDNGFIYSVPTNNPKFQNRLYKLNEEGKILDSLYIGNDSVAYTLYLHRQNNKNYIIAAEYPMYLNDKAAILANIYRVLFEIDDNLKITSYKKYNKLPFGFSRRVSRYTEGIACYHSESARIEKDTLQFVQFSLNVDSTGTIIMEQQTYYEELGLGTNDFYKSTKLLATQNVYNTAITKDYFYVFGEINPKFFPPNEPYNAGLMGRFDKTGKLLQNATTDIYNSGAMGDGLVGVIENGKIYCAYSQLFSPIINVERLATFDRRDMNFKVEKKTQVKTMGMIPRGSNPFAFSTNGDIYFLAQKEDTIGITKHSKDLDFIWEKKYKLPQHYGISLKTTKDGGLILECTEFTAPGISNVRLYKINAEGLVTSSTNLGEISDSKPLLYPNPFEDNLKVAFLSPTAFNYFLTDITGRIVKKESVIATNFYEILTQDLAKGIYILNLKTSDGGVFSKKIVKQ
jgi:Secretion system C-terminal sorting domain